MSACPDGATCRHACGEMCLRQKQGWLPDLQPVPGDPKQDCIAPPCPYFACATLGCCARRKRQEEEAARETISAAEIAGGAITTENPDLFKTVLSPRPVTKWDRRFLAMAKLVSSWSKDPSTKFGVVIARPDHTVASLGFNGFPRGCSDADALYANREEKYGRVVHAEVNSILTARERLNGYSLYIYPGGSGPTCDRCAACVIQAGIAEVVYEHDPEAECVGRWGEAMERGLRMYEEAGVAIIRAPLGSSDG